MSRSSRIPGFHRLDRAGRLAVLRAALGGDDADSAIQALGGPEEFALLDRFVENAVGAFPLPLGIAANFTIDGRDLLVPMAIEETSVVAAASNMARLARAGGGFRTEVVEDLAIGQVQVVGIRDPEQAAARVLAGADEIVALANGSEPALAALGGGCRGIEARPFLAGQTGAEAALVVHLLVDCGDAMGANSVDTICEAAAPLLARITGGRPGLRIVSNLADRRRFRASVSIPLDALATGALSGEEVGRRIAEASDSAAWDPYRAATHNKGIMNGVDAVLVATGNDWRAVEAGAHAFAARSGRYMPLSRWWTSGGRLLGEMEIPLQVGIVGGMTRRHPVAAFSLRLLGVRRGPDLARVVAAVGLAQNLGALRALSTEGIQKGHMRLRARARGEQR